MAEERIKKDVVDRLYWDKLVNASSLAVNVYGTWVTMEGELWIYAVRQSAEYDCSSELWVAVISNNLKIRHSGTATSSSDNQIEKRSKPVQEWNSNMNARNIDVFVRSWVVMDKEDFGQGIDVYIQKPGAWKGAFQADIRAFFPTNGVNTPLSSC